MFKDKKLAFQALYAVRDICLLQERLLKTIRVAQISEDERTSCLNMVHQAFDNPVTDILVALHKEHPETALVDYGHPPGYWK